MSEVIVREATPDDLPILLEFEQGVIEAERPMDSGLKEGPINYYDIERRTIYSSDACDYRHPACRKTRT